MVFVLARERFKSRAPTLAVLMTVTIAACDRAPKANPLAASEPTRRVTYQDSVDLGWVRPRPPGLGAFSSTAAAVDPGLSYTLTPGNHIGYDQPQTIVGTVAGIANKVVINGSGAVLCSGNYGSIIAYDSLNAIIGQTAITISDPADCSPPDNPDNVTGWTQAVLNVASGQIRKFEITAMSPLSGPVWNQRDGVYVNGNFQQTYNVTVTGPTSSITVTCTPATVTRASATPVSCTATASGTLAITGWKFTATDPAIGSVTSSQTSVKWEGMAVASGAVTVQGSVGGVTAVSDTGRISVTPRTTGWSWAADTSTGDARAGTFDCNLQPHYNTGQFGLTHADSTCKNIGVMLWPDPSSSKRGYKIAQVPAGGPNAGLWYAATDVTGMHVRAQVLKDIRPDATPSYSVTGKDTVATRCKAAGVSGKATVTVVNNTCMTDPSSFNFAALYAFAWRHERCHLMQMRNAFPAIPDPRTKLETIVRSDTMVFHTAALYDAGGYNDANSALTGANTIDVPGPPPPYTFWSRNTTNTAWFLRTYPPNGILATGC